MFQPKSYLPLGKYRRVLFWRGVSLICCSFSDLIFAYILTGMCRIDPKLFLDNLKYISYWWLVLLHTHAHISFTMKQIGLHLSLSVVWNSRRLKEIFLSMEQFIFSRNIHNQLQYWETFPSFYSKDLVVVFRSWQDVMSSENCRF